MPDLDAATEAPKLRVGAWIAVNEDGVWQSPFLDERYCFVTKKEVIDLIADAVLDARKKPRVERLAQGQYLYYPKDCDTETFGDVYDIVKLTKQNINDYLQLIPS